LRVATRGQQGRFVDQILEIRTHEAGSAPGLNLQVDIVGEGDSPGVNLENLEPAAKIGTRNDDPAIESPGSQQGGI
jgi:hypothetical protein